MIPEILFKALGDANRLRIMNLLLKGELCVCDIEEVLGLTQTNVSRHLARMTAAGILDSRKSAQWVYYRINADFEKNHSRLMDYLRASLGNDKNCRSDSNALAKRKSKGASQKKHSCGAQ